MDFRSVLLPKSAQRQPLPTTLQPLSTSDHAALKASARPDKTAAISAACPTFATIPPFYQRLPTAADSLGQKLREEARTLFLQKRSRELLDNNELKSLWALLDGAHLRPTAVVTNNASTTSPPPPPPPPLPNAAKYITYDAYLGVQRAAGPKCRRYLTSAIFARLLSVSSAAASAGRPLSPGAAAAAASPAPPLVGCVGILALFNYVMRKVWLQQTRIGLSLYDYTGQGYLREPNLEAYILELIPTLPQLEGLEPSFHSFYVCTAVRKFFFFLDPLGTGRVRIRDILACSFLDDLLELRDDDDGGGGAGTGASGAKEAQEINWFSAPSALSVYGHYLNLDRDHNGMLSRDELAGYGSGTLTDVFLERVFAECHTYNGEMDYKTYLDFVLALENRSEPQSMHYLFRLLDFEHCGYLTAFALQYFFKGIEAQIVAHRAERVNFEDVKDEIFDMVKPAHPGRITLKDLLRR